MTRDEWIKAIRATITDWDAACQNLRYFEMTAERARAFREEE